MKQELVDSIVQYNYYTYDKTVISKDMAPKMPHNDQFTDSSLFPMPYHRQHQLDSSSLHQNQKERHKIIYYLMKLTMHAIHCNHHHCWQWLRHLPSFSFLRTKNENCRWNCLRIMKASHQATQKEPLIYLPSQNLLKPSLSKITIQKGIFWGGDWNWSLSKRVTKIRRTNNAHKIEVFCSSSSCATRNIKSLCAQR